MTRCLSSSVSHTPFGHPHPSFSSLRYAIAILSSPKHTLPATWSHKGQSVVGRIGSSGHVAGRSYGHLRRFLALAGLLRAVSSPVLPFSPSRLAWKTFILTFSHSLSTMLSHSSFILDMRRDVQEIFRTTPHHKQVMMFSATLAKEIRATCKKFMANVRPYILLDASISSSITFTAS